MRIDQNNIALSAYRNLDSAQGTAAKTAEKHLESDRSPRAARDAFGLVISQGLRAQNSGLSLAMRNAQDGISVVQTAAGALSRVHAMLDRVRDLVGQAANTAPSDRAAREAGQHEIAQLRSDIDGIGQATTFDGQKLLNGGFGVDFHIGAPVASTDQISVSIDDIRITGGTSASFTSLSGIDVTNTATFGSAQVLVDDAIASVSTLRVQLGAAQNRFESTIASLQVGSENLAASASRIRGTDMALDMVSLTRQQILLQPATALRAQGNAAPQSLLRLLQ